MCDCQNYPVKCPNCGGWMLNNTTPQHCEDCGYCRPEREPCRAEWNTECKKTGEKP